MNRAGKIISYFILSLVLLLVYSESSYGQRWKLRRYEVGFGLGAVQVFGDIGGTADENNWLGVKDISFADTRPCLNAFIRYKIDPRYSVRASVYSGFAKGADENSRNDRGRVYKTKLFEFSGQFEYYFVKEEKTYRSSGMYSRRGMLNNYSHYAFYGFAGVGAAYTISKHEYPSVLENDIYKDGSNMGVVFPFGLGAKFILDSRYSLNAQFGYRYTLSDYIEGYKNIYSKHNDVYYFMEIALTYRLKTSKRNLPAFIDRRYKKYGY